MATTKPTKPPLTKEELKEKNKEFRKQFMNSMATSMSMVIMMLFLLPKILSSTGIGALQAQTITYRGRTDQRDLQAVNTLRWIDLIADPPYTPWIHCFIINDGPGAAEIAINHPNDKFTMGPGETRTIDRTSAEDRILSIFYNSVPGQTANLRVTGEY